MEQILVKKPRKYFMIFVVPKWIIQWLLWAFWNENILLNIIKAMDGI